MNRALVIKELRECAPLGAIAALAAAWALCDLTGALSPWLGRPSPGVPFVQSDDPYGYLITIAGGLAVALGFKQTAWEEFRGTFHYLLHRPIDRRRVFLVKAAVGVALVQAVGAAVILIYGFWAATPGTHASPFFWSMTKQTWQIWFAMPTVYLAAFLCGLRPARWYGSRLLPLVGAGMVAMTLAIQPWLWIAIAGAAALGAVCVAAALEVARTRDY
jgi:hypothetical protein